MGCFTFVGVDRDTHSVKCRTTVHNGGLERFNPLIVVLNTLLLVLYETGELEEGVT